MKKSTLWPLLFLLVFVGSCRKDGEEKINRIDDPEALSQTEVETLDRMPEAIGFSHNTVVLPNGETLEDYLTEVDEAFVRKWMGTDVGPYANLGPQDARNLLIARITAVALNLTDRSKHQKASEGPGKPAQNGLAYSWGSKDHTKRQAPPGGGTACTHQVYGLDCSGFVHQLFVNAGVSLPTGPADSQRKETVLQNAIKSSIPSLDKVKVEDLGAIPTADFETGDIIYWTNESGVATHIGVILKDVGGKLAVFQSNGSSGADAGQCDGNLGQNRGARRLQLNDPYWFGSTKPYAITRINAEISGQWTLFMRCEGYATDAITLQLQFPTTNANTFSITGSGIDYDNLALVCSGELAYDKAKNVLSGTIRNSKPATPTFYRYDSFSVKLDRDETEYFNMVLGENREAGCPVEGRLLNNE